MADSLPPKVFEAMAHVVVWNHAVQLQQIRLLATGTGMPDGPMTRQSDGYLFAVALRNLRRAIALVRKVAPKEAWSGIDRALNAFDHHIPDTVNLRNALEHFDDYSLGKGDLQTGGGGPPSEWYDRGENTYRFNLAVTPGAAPLTVEVREATIAAIQLVSAVESALLPPAI